MRHPCPRSASGGRGSNPPLWPAVRCVRWAISDRRPCDVRPAIGRSSTGNRGRRRTCPLTAGPPGRTIQGESKAIETGRPAMKGRGYEACGHPRGERSAAKEHAMQPILKSAKLANVCYDIRGPVLDHARQMEEEGHRIIKLNIGNPAAFGFEAPEEIVQDVIHNLPGRLGLLRLQGALRGAQGGDALHPGEAHPRRAARGHLHRQRRLRADRDGDAGAAQQRRRGADPRAGLPALDGRGEPRRRHAAPLPLRRAGRLAARDSTTSAPRSRRTRGRSWSSTRTTRPARSTPTSCCGRSSRSRASTS